MYRKLDPVLNDILDRIEKILNVTASKTFEDFDAGCALRSNAPSKISPKRSVISQTKSSTCNLTYLGP